MEYKADKAILVMLTENEWNLSGSGIQTQGGFDTGGVLIGQLGRDSEE